MNFFRNSQSVMSCAPKKKILNISILTKAPSIVVQGKDVRPQNSKAKYKNHKDKKEINGKEGKPRSITL